MRTINNHFWLCSHSVLNYSITLKGRFTNFDLLPVDSIYFVKSILIWVENLVNSNFSPKEHFMRTYVHVVSTKCSVNQILKTNIFTSVKRLLGRPVPQRHMSAWWCGLCVLCTIPGGKTNLPIYSDYPAGIRRISVLPAILWRTSCGLLTVIRRMSSGRIMGSAYRPHTQTAAVVSAPRKRRGKPLIFSGPLKMKVWPIF